MPLSLKHISSPYRAIQTPLKLRGEKKNTEEGEKRVVGEGERKEEREMKQSPRILLCALLCSTHLNQEKFCIFMAFSVSCDIKDNYILG